MLEILLFFGIGQSINAGVFYWVCFALLIIRKSIKPTYYLGKLIYHLGKARKELDEEEENDE